MVALGNLNFLIGQYDEYAAWGVDDGSAKGVEHCGSGGDGAGGFEHGAVGGFGEQ